MKKPLKLRKGYIRKQSKRLRARLERELWALFSKYIKDRDNWTCITTGKRIVGSAMNAGHFHPQGLYKRVKFNPRNVHAQSAGDNCWKHGNLTVYAEKLIEKYGPEIINELKRAKEKDPILTDKQLIELIDTLENRPEDYENAYFEMMKEYGTIKL